MKYWMILLILIPALSFASYLKEHERGWHWYDDPKELISQRKIPTLSPSQQIELLQSQAKERLNIALLNPTKTNIKNYIKLQNYLVKKSSLFSNQWQKVIWQDPHLNFGFEHPTSDVGKQAYYLKNNTIQTKAINDISQRYGLFFYFSNQCIYCQKMAPTVKAFTEHYHFEVLPITINGESLPEFPNAKFDNGSMMQLQVNTVPALFLVDKQSKNITPIGFGLMDFNELEKRIVTLILNKEHVHA